MTSYKNPYHSANILGSKPVITTDAVPVSYKGFLIYRRLPDCFDIVKDGVCVNMYAGINGAKKAIDDKKAIPHNFKEVCLLLSPE